MHLGGFHWSWRLNGEPEGQYPFASRKKKEGFETAGVAG
jgi:hypothetical protein